MMSYLCNLIWPYVSSYWVSAVYLFSIRNKANQTAIKRLLVEVRNFVVYSEIYIRYNGLPNQCLMRELLNSMKCALWILLRTL